MRVFWGQQVIGDLRCEVGILAYKLVVGFAVLKVGGCGSGSEI